MKIAWVAVLNIAALACGGQSIAADRPSTRAAPLDSARLVNASSEPQNWLTHGGTYEERRFSPLRDINPATIDRLGMAWSLELDTDRGQESTPLVVDGVMFVTTAWSKVVAIDAATGAKIWQFDPKVPGKAGIKACCDVVNRGAAYDNGMVYVGTIDGRLIGIDAKTGKQRWSAQTTDVAKPYAITGAPRIARGKVFIGNGGADQGMRGYVSAYDAKTGALVWRFYTVPGDPAKPDHAASDEILERIARPTWFGDQYFKFGGGGTVWDSIVYDPGLNRLYIGVGNAGPWSRAIRSDNKGDNLFVASVVALDADTGRYIWHYQETPGDSWDFTSSQQMILADLRIAGSMRKVILHAPKNGFFYVIDRETGKLVSAEKFAPVNWAERIDLASGRPVENPAARYDDGAPYLATSGPWGAHSWHPMSFSPTTGLVYIPAQQVPGLYARDGNFTYRPGLLALGVDLGKLPEKPADIAAMMKSISGWLVAWDPVAQKEVWRAPHGGAWNGGVLSTAGGLVFQGLADGTFRAYDASNGKQLWQFEAQTTVLPGPISYSVKGVQYVAVVVGYGTAYNLAMPNFRGPISKSPGRVLSFRIDGNAKLAVPNPGTAAPLNPSAESWSSTQVSSGERLYSTMCAACHGAGALSGGVIPDLRRSAALTDANTWRQIVIGGILETRGMISFRDYLNSSQADEIRGYVNGRASAH